MDDQLAFLVDPVLKNDDVNNDGLIDYAEFIAAQIRNRQESKGAGVRSSSRWSTDKFPKNSYIVCYVQIRNSFVLHQDKKSFS